MSAQPKTAIVRVCTAGGTGVGAGFLVTNNGLIVTCSHVVAAAGATPGDHVYLVFHTTSEKRMARVEPSWWSDPDAEDIAILRLEEPLPVGAIPLPLGSTNRAIGCTFSTFGFPEAKPVEGMAGKCEVIGRTTEKGFPILQMRSQEITRGFSGAPIWDDTLQVAIGVVVNIARQDPYGKQFETAFLIPAETLRKVCPALRFPQLSPYRGLQVFEAEHADFYFGREAATCELIEMLSQLDFVTVIGVSGSGKSSLVRAGIAKGLQQYPIPGLAERSRCLLIPGSAPILNLVLALAHLPDQTSEAVLRSFALLPDVLAEHNEARRQVDDVLRAHSPQSLAQAFCDLFRAGGLLLVVDQLERLYTECQDEYLRRRFLDTLLAASHSGVKIVLALRADFYGLALEHADLARAMKAGQFMLLPMVEEELRCAIEKPAQALGCTFQPGLADRIVADVRGRAGDLPLLEFALAELWERDAGQSVITPESYEQLGYTTPDGQHFPGVHGAIAQRAEAVWRNLNDEVRQAAQRVFLGLVTPGPMNEQGTPMSRDMSRRTWLAELHEPARQAVELLVQARLLTTGQDAFTGQPTVEVAHEALLRSWPRLQQWLSQYRPFVTWYDHEFAPFLRLWLEKEQRSDLLLPSSILEPARLWLSQYPAELAGAPAEFIEASVHAIEQAQIRLHRTTRARQLAERAHLALDNSATGLVRSGLLAIESLRIAPSAEGELALRRFLDLAPQLRFVLDQPHKDITTVAFTEDDQRLLVASLNGTVQVWDLTSSQVVTEIADEDKTNIIFLSPNGRWMVSRSRSAVRVYDVNAELEVARMTLPNHLSVLAFSPDGRWMVTAGEDGAFQVWDITTGCQATSLLGSQLSSPLALSPDGRFLAATSQYRHVHVLEVATGREVWQARHQGWIVALTFSPDGCWLATASQDSMLAIRSQDPATRVWEAGVECVAGMSARDNTARVWDITNGREISRVTHAWLLTALAFSPDGRWLATGSADHTARVWSAKTGQEIARMVHTEPELTNPKQQFQHRLGAVSYDGGTLRAVAFSPDNRSLATVTADGRVRVWQGVVYPGTVQVLHASDVRTLAFSPDGGWLATGSDDQSACVWDVSTGKKIIQVTYRGQVDAVAFTPDGRWLVADSTDSIGVYAAPGHHALGHERPECTQILHSYSDNHYHHTFSPNGRWLVTVSSLRCKGAPGSLYVSEMRIGHGYGQKLVSVDRVVGFSSGVNEGFGAVAISPNGRYVAALIGSYIGSPACMHVWEINPQRKVIHGDYSFTSTAAVGLKSYGPSVQSMVFSPDGRLLATAGLDGTARVWEIPSGREIVRMVHQNNLVLAVAFGPDGQYLATASRDCTVRVWEISSARELTRLPHPGKHSILALTFSPDGRWLATGSSDGSARLWLWRTEDLISQACARLRRNLTQQECQYYIA